MKMVPTDWSIFILVAGELFSDVGGLSSLIVHFHFVCHLMVTMLKPLQMRSPLITTGLVMFGLNFRTMTFSSLGWLGFDLWRLYLLFFMAGVLVRHWRVALPAPKPGIMVGLLFLLLTSMWMNNGVYPIDVWFSGILDSRHQLLVQSYHVLTALMGIADLCILASRHQQVTELLRSIWIPRGRKSLQTYAGHYIFLYFAVGFSVYFHLPRESAIPLITGMALGGALLVAIFLKCLPPVQRLAFGR